MRGEVGYLSVQYSKMKCLLDDEVNDEVGYLSIRYSKMKCLLNDEVNDEVNDEGKGKLELRNHLYCYLYCDPINFSVRLWANVLKLLQDCVKSDNLSHCVCEFRFV